MAPVFGIVALKFLKKYMLVTRSYGMFITSGVVYFMGLI
tara:strand:+ start:815 stop:931 length:117 start_codon:yes stop_codon:yes gene_type:complete